MIFLMNPHNLTSYVLHDFTYVLDSPGVSLTYNRDNPGLIRGRLARNTCSTWMRQESGYKVTDDS